MKTFLAAALATPLLLGGLLFALFQWAGDDLPRPRSFAEVESSRKSRVLDRKGRLIQEFYVENRVPVSLKKIPEPFLQALIATEDRQFYRHWGLDMVAILRALKADLLAGEFTQGASTITQQLARSLYLTFERTILRKLREAVLAIRLERAFGKDEILELYANQVYFGEGAYGIEAAAQRFFGVPAQELTVPQCALLAGVIANPSAFSPRRHPEAARRRRNLVLRRMLDMGFLDQEAFETYRAESLGLSPRKQEVPLAPYAAEMVRQYVIQKYGAQALFHEGLTVWTTIDLDLQEVAEQRMEEHLEWIEQTYGPPSPAEGSEADTADIGPLQAAVVGIEPQTGAIRVLIGGRDFRESPFNRAVQAHRQPGSAIKPIVYLTALERGWKTNDLLVDAPVEYEVRGVPEEERFWSPQNFDGTYAGPVILRYALAKSINVVAVRLLELVGVENVLATARRLGIQSPLSPVMSLALGTSEVTPMELTVAYATLANHGIRVTPYLVERVEDRYGATLEEHAPESTPVVDERHAFLITHMLESVFDFGTARTARNWGFQAPAAGKTGTTDDYTDAWFVGYTPRFALGVWVGYDRKVPIGHRVTGAVAALPIWAQVMGAVVDRQGPVPFQPPRGIRTVRTCLDSGKLAGPFCPHPVEDAFLEGTEPIASCDLHGPMASTRTSGVAGTFRERDALQFREGFR
jgi:penicillin-binding protein 1A